ncbi:uncharacterized protein LOC144021879 [Festucalex cinctus]
MGAQVVAFFFTAASFFTASTATADQACQTVVVVGPEIQTEEGFKFTIPVARGQIFVSQNEKSIAHGNLSSNTPTFTWSEEVLFMDNNSIITKYFRDTEVKVVYRDERGEWQDNCILYKANEMPDESTPLNITRGPDINNRRPLRIGLIFAVLLFIPVCVAIIIRALNGVATPCDCFKHRAAGQNSV